MIERFGKILIRNGESLGTMTEPEMIEYLLNELNEAEFELERYSDYDELQDEISDLEHQVSDLELQVWSFERALEVYAMKEGMKDLEERCG